MYEDRYVHGSAERTSPERQAMWLNFIHDLILDNEIVDSELVRVKMGRCRSYANGFLKLGVDRGLWFLTPAIPPARGHRFTLQPPSALPKQLPLPDGIPLPVTGDMYSDFAQLLNVDRVEARRRLLKFTYWAWEDYKRQKGGG